MVKTAPLSAAIPDAYRGLEYARERVTTIPVRFDDRLQTVLRQPASDPRDAAVRWRQLVDLIARAGPAADSDTLAEALSVIRADSSRIDEPLRAAAARSIAAIPLPFGLLQCFVADRLSVSSPILAAASLEPDMWVELLKEADDETRRFVQTLHRELSLGPVAPSPTPVERELIEERAETPPSASSISAMIERIGRHRQRRAAPIASAPPAQPAAAGPSVFRWECAANGEIGWVDGVPRGTMIGRSIAKAAEINGDRLDPAVVRAFGQRAPFREAELTIAGQGAIAGSWKLSGVPAFDPADGRFAGYRGIALKEITVPAASHGLGLTSLPLALEGDSLRELVHEIKTPLNAIIGFAEIIDGQYLGPAGRDYRARATDIARQARLLLEAIVDLDLAAQSQSSGVRGGLGKTDLSAATEAALGALAGEAEQRGIELHPELGKAAETLAEPRFLDRLIQRLIAAAIELAVRGERLRVAVAASGGQARLAVARPLAMPGLDDPTASARAESLEGLFSLRLARGLARIAGGELKVDEESLELAFPLA